MDAQELHARFGGDEFCFLIPDLDAAHDALDHRRALPRARSNATTGRRGSSGWREQPVRVDVGVVCLLLGPVERAAAGARVSSRRDLLARRATSRDVRSHEDASRPGHSPVPCVSLSQRRRDPSQRPGSVGLLGLIRRPLGTRRGVLSSYTRVLTGTVGVAQG